MSIIVAKWTLFLSLLCEGVGLVKRVHTLLSGVHRFATNLKEAEEVRQEVREVKDEGKGEINVEGEPHSSRAHVDDNEMTDTART